MLLEVRDLIVEVGARRVVDQLSLHIADGERVALVGASGSGKSLTALAIADLIERPFTMRGELVFSGVERSKQSLDDRRQLRGKHAAIVFQDPLAALNPVYTAGEQIAEVLRVRAGLDRSAAKKRVLELLDRVHLPARVAKTYPHELSGGMRQRVMIARALSLDPKLIIADEPTTALDRKTEAEVMDVLLEATAGRALLLISHDLELVTACCTRAYVIDRGRIVEDGPIETLLSKPEAPETRAMVELFQAPVEREARRELGPPLLEIRGLSKRFDHLSVLEDVSFDVPKGGTVAIVGESGAGKTTLARCIARLVSCDQGEIVFAGTDLAKLGDRALRPLRRRFQIIAQDPSGALDPRMRVDAILREPLLIHGDGSGATVSETLAKVGLDPALASRFPHQLSGGEKQRVAIARALVLEPELLILDEPMSALDVTSQVLLLDLLDRLQASLQLTYLLITHDPKLVRRLADRVVLLRAGRVVC